MLERIGKFWNGIKVNQSSIGRNILVWIFHDVKRQQPSNQLLQSVLGEDSSTFYGYKRNNFNSKLNEMSIWGFWQIHHLRESREGEAEFVRLPIEFPRSRGERVLSNLQQDWKSRTDPRASLEKGPAPTSLNLSVWISWAPVKSGSALWCTGSASDRSVDIYINF